MFLYIIGAILIFLTILHYLIHHSSTGRLINQIPGPPVHFVLGNAPDLLSSPSGLFYIGRNWANKYKTTYRIWSFYEPLLNIIDPEDCEILLSSPKHITKSEVYTFLQPWLRFGLLTSTGEKWQKRRKVLTPTFHFNILSQFCDAFNEECLKLVKKCTPEVGNDATDILPLVSHFTLNTICETAMGTKLDDTSQESVDYISSIKTMSELVVYRLMRIWYYPRLSFNLSAAGRHQKSVLKMLHKFTNDVISRRRLARPFTSDQISSAQEDAYIGKKKRMAMLDLLLAAEDEGQIDQNGIREEVDTFTFEGHDTTTMAVTFCLMELANNPEVQSHIVEELNQIYEHKDEPITIDKLNAMYYLERCIKEALRLYPSVPFFARLLSVDMQLKNYLIPAGTTVNVHTFDLHRRADIYPDPEKFDPDRFLPENCAKRHPYAYVPFSAGPRNCIGQKFAFLEMKAIISTILRNYKLEPVTRPEDIIFTADIILKTQCPVKVKFLKRDD